MLPSSREAEQLHGGWRLFSFRCPGLERNNDEFPGHGECCESHANGKRKHGIQIVLFHSGDHVLRLKNSQHWAFWNIA